MKKGLVTIQPSRLSSYECVIPDDGTTDSSCQYPLSAQREKLRLNFRAFLAADSIT